MAQRHAANELAGKLGVIRIHPIVSYATIRNLEEGVDWITSTLETDGDEPPSAEGLPSR